MTVRWRITKSKIWKSELNTSRHCVDFLKFRYYFPGWLCHFKGRFHTCLARNLPVENSKCDVMTIDQQEAGDIWRRSRHSVWQSFFFPRVNLQYDSNQAKGVDRIKVMFHETIRNDVFQRNTVLQHCCDIVSNGYNIVPALQLCQVALKIDVANRPL